MKFTKKFGLAMVAICLVMSLASCQNDGVELTEEQFIQACKDGDAELVKNALKKNKKLANAKDDSEETALMKALSYCHKEIAELLIAKGADVNAKDEFEETALMKASVNCPKEIVELLIAKDADVNAKDNNGRTALMRATGDVGRKEIAELLIAKGADVNAKDNNGRTALMSASRFGKKDIVELLIAKGADVNVQDKNGTSALLYAVGKGKLEIVKTLVENGARLTIKYESGENAALKDAQDNGHTEVVEYLKQQLEKLPSSFVYNYIRIKDWREVKLKQKEFIGKRIAVRAMFMSLSMNGTEINLDLDGFVGCPFDKKLVDKILELKEYYNYAFYGTVIEGNWIDPVLLYIEDIQLE